MALPRGMTKPSRRIKHREDPTKVPPLLKEARKRAWYFSAIGAHSLLYSSCAT